MTFLTDLLSVWTQTVSPGTRGDINLNGLVDIDDLTLLLNDFNSPTPDANFYLVPAQAGETITIELAGTNGEPSIWVFRGSHGDTDDMTDATGNTFNLSNHFYLDYAEETSATGGAGNAQSVFTATANDFYTVAVMATALVGQASANAADGFSYVVSASASAAANPEPITATLSVLALGGLGLYLRRRRAE